MNYTLFLCCTVFHVEIWSVFSTLHFAFYKKISDFEFVFGLSNYRKHTHQKGLLFGKEFKLIVQGQLGAVCQRTTHTTQTTHEYS
jgi:hypothetical protein